MCNDYEQHIRYAEYRNAVRELHLCTSDHESEADLRQSDDIRIGDLGPVMRGSGNGVELSQMTFGSPQGPRRTGVQLPLRGRHFSDSKRCLILASAFFEFTGKKYPKAKHRFTLADHPMMAICRSMAGRQRQSAAIVHHADDRARAGRRPDPCQTGHRPGATAMGRLDLPRQAEGELLAPLPQGSLNIEKVRPGSD
jgi:putative SOS response-associated peptidase YedK